MIRKYCDLCGAEILNDNTFHNGMQATKRVNTKDAGLVEFTVDLMSEDTNIDVCKYCVIEAVNRLDDRDKPVCFDCGK